MPIYQLHDKHGKHIAQNSLEAENNNKYGWRTVTEDEFNADIRAKLARLEAQNTVQAKVDDIEARYEAKYGKRPHHRMKRETIEASLNDDGG